MGDVLSRLRADSQGVAYVFREASSLGLKYKALLDRISSDPGLPVENPTVSYWMQDPPHPELLDRQDDLPCQADIVIIGSGITGAAIARTICELHDRHEEREPPTIVVLEARQLCSGATARNGGHIKCTPYSQYTHLQEQFGDVAARKILRLHLMHRELLGEVCEEVRQGEVRAVRTADLFLEESDFCEAKKGVEALARAMPEIEVKVWEGKAAQAEFGVNHFVAGALSFESGALWPFRLVTGVWHRLCEGFPNLKVSTHTSVQSVSRSDDTRYPYTVDTSKGKVQARHVVHATNGYTGKNIPELRRCLTGVLGHMSAQRPGNEFPQKHGKASWSIMDAPGFDYVSQRPDREDGKSGDLMIGGGLGRSKDLGLDQFGVWDDSRIDAFPLMHVRGAMAALFEPRWGSGSELIKAWTGIMGFTGDLLPFVGRVPAEWRGISQKPGFDGSGEWVAAGFNGSGMIWAWLSGTALGTMILGKENDEMERGIGRPGGRLHDWYPVEECAISPGRLERAELRKLPEVL